MVDLFVNKTLFSTFFYVHFVRHTLNNRLLQTLTPLCCTIFFFFFSSSSLRSFGNTQFALLALPERQTRHLFGHHWSNLLCSRQLRREAADERQHQLWRPLRWFALLLPLFLSQSEWQVLCTQNPTRLAMTLPFSTPTFKVEVWRLWWNFTIKCNVWCM